jgi:hypothetical protein
LIPNLLDGLARTKRDELGIDLAFSCKTPVIAGVPKQRDSILFFILSEQARAKTKPS